MSDVFYLYMYFVFQKKKNKMATSGIVRSISTRNVKKLERPRPLKTSISSIESSHNKYSVGQCEYC